MLCDSLGVDLLEVDYHAYADEPLDEARAGLGTTAEVGEGPGRRITRRRSTVDGMSHIQQEYAAALAEG